MIRRLGLATAAIATVATLAGCYRPTPPAGLGETVRIEVVGNRGQLPRTQVYLMTEIARVMDERLGWATSPTGTAHLDLAIQEERIQSQAEDVRGIPISWSIRVRVCALLATRQGSRVGTCEGTGNVTSLSGEPEALQAAAAAAAKQLEGWLENAAREIGQNAPKVPKTP